MNKDEKKLLSEVRTEILKANYEGALTKIISLRKSSEKNFEIDFTYAKVLGDYADELPPAKRSKLKLESSRILEKLLRRMNGQPEDVRFGARINYYYQTRRFRDLEKVGTQLSKTNKVKGLYASGLGASLEAESLAKGNSSSRRKSLKFAERSLKHWKKYFQLNPRETYYFPYSLQAMSFAILGKVEEMEKALSKSAKLSGRKKDYWEFEEVRELAAKLKTN